MPSIKTGLRQTPTRFPNSLEKVSYTEINIPNGEITLDKLRQYWRSAFHESFKPNSFFPNTKLQTVLSIDDTCFTFNNYKALKHVIFCLTDE